MTELQATLDGGFHLRNIRMYLDMLKRMPCESENEAMEWVARGADLEVATVQEFFARQSVERGIANRIIDALVRLDNGHATTT